MITNAYITVEVYENLTDTEPSYQFKGKPVREYKDETHSILHWIIITDSRLCDITRIKKGDYLGIKYGNLQGKFSLDTITPHIWVSGAYEFVLECK